MVWCGIKWDEVELRGLIFPFRPPREGAGSVGNRGDVDGVGAVPTVRQETRSAEADGEINIPADR